MEIMFKEYKLNQALSFMQRGQNAQAINTLKEILAEEPNNAQSHGLLALCLLNDKRIYAAEYEVQLGLNNDAQLPFLHNTLAKIKLLKNKPKSALLHCDDALRLDPNDVDSVLLKAEIFSSLNNNNETINCINDAAKIEPDNIEINLAYGSYYFNKGNINKAELYAIEAIQQDAQNIDAIILLGRIKLKQSNYEEALNLAKFAIIQNPDSEAALKLFCDIKVKQNLFLGLWWRFNSKMSNMSPIKSAIILISMFLTFNFLSQIMQDLDFPTIAKTISYGWLLFVIYSWVGAPMYKNKLKKELSKFKFNDNY